MFRHQSAILTEFNNNKGSKVRHVIWQLVALILIFTIKDIIVIKLPEDGTLFPKHAGVGTYHEEYFVFCVLLYFI